MNMAVTKHEEPIIRLDKSKQYSPNAGECKYCGNLKTWDFRIENPKTGKMIPGHISKEGYKINDGDCPYWAIIKMKKKAQQGDPILKDKKDANQKHDFKISKSPKILVNAYDGKIKLEVAGTVNGLVLSREDAVDVCYEILGCLKKT